MASNHRSLLPVSEISRCNSSCSEHPFLTALEKGEVALETEEVDTLDILHRHDLDSVEVEGNPEKHVYARLESSFLGNEMFPVRLVGIDPY